MADGPLTFELTDFISKDELTRIIAAYSAVTNLASGIVLMPIGAPTIPTTDEDLARSRVTAVVNESEFCKIIRGCVAGNRACMDSDLKHAKESFQSGHSRCYACHIGITDVIAPIRVGGTHIANVYLGQFRTPRIKFDKVLDQYHVLLSQSESVRIKASDEELRKAFDGLQSVGKDRIEPIRELADILADLISQRATRHAVMAFAQAAAKEVGSTLNLRKGLDTYLRYAMALLGGDTGSIFLSSEDGTHLQSQVRYWGGHAEGGVYFTLAGPGTIALCARENYKSRNRLKPLDTPSDKSVSRLPALPYCVRKNSRAELNATCDEQLPGIRDHRQLQSIIVVPIYYGDQLLGTLDVGSKRPNAFTADDEHILHLFALEIGFFVRKIRERHRLVQVFIRRNLSELIWSIAREAPSDVSGVGCSIFLRDDQGKAVLRATSEYDDSIIGNLEYAAGEGLTGWVFKSGRPLRIPSGPQCRTKNLPRDYVDHKAVWKGKLPANVSDDRVGNMPEGRSYYESRPFLAVPIRDRADVIQGVIRIPDRSKGEFTDDDLRFIQSYADYIGHMIGPSPEHRRRRRKEDSKAAVFLAYGHDISARDLMTSFVRGLDIEVNSYEEVKKAGRFPIDIVRECVEKSDAAIVLYTGDDLLKSQEIAVARRNVAYELGVAHWAFGPERTLILLEEGVEFPSNVDGMQVVRFNPRQLPHCYDEVRTYLERMGLI
ncbi:MAG: PocR ligand-binding domain-containing protein [Phycisphaeraceae bacterium]